MQVDCIHAVVAISFLSILVLVGQIILRPPSPSQLIYRDSDAAQEGPHLAATSIPPTVVSPETIVPKPKHRSFTSGHV